MSGSSSAAVLSMTRGSLSCHGFGTTGTEPVAMMQFWNLIVCGRLAGDLDRVRVEERRVALDDLDAAALGELADAAGELADDLLLHEGAELLQVELRFAEARRRARPPRGLRG